MMEKLVNHHVRISATYMKTFAILAKQIITESFQRLSLKLFLLRVFGSQR